MRLVPMVEAELQHHRTGPQGDRQDVPLPQPELLLDRPFGRQGDPGRPLHQQRHRQGRRRRQPGRGGVRRDRQHRLHRSQGPRLDHAGLYAGREVQPGQEGDPGVRLDRPGRQHRHPGEAARTRSITTCSSRCRTSSRSRRSSTAFTAMCPAGRFPRSTPVRSPRTTGSSPTTSARSCTSFAARTCWGRLKSRYQLMDTSTAQAGITGQGRPGRREGALRPAEAHVPARRADRRPARRTSCRWPSKVANESATSFT